MREEEGTKFNKEKEKVQVCDNVAHVTFKSIFISTLIIMALGGTSTLQYRYTICPPRHSGFLVWYGAARSMSWDVKWPKLPFLLLLLLLISFVPTFWGMQEGGRRGEKRKKRRKIRHTRSLALYCSEKGFVGSSAPFFGRLGRKKVESSN